MRRYETIYILRPSLGEEEITTIVENTNGIVTDDGGAIIEMDRWGMRKLAYPIEKEIQGFYVYFDYAGTPAAVSELERKFRIDDSVLRYMTIKTAEAMSSEEVESATGEVTARKEAELAAEAETAAPEAVEASKETASTTEAAPEAGKAAEETTSSSDPSPEAAE